MRPHRPIAPVIALLASVTTAPAAPDPPATRPANPVTVEVLHTRLSRPSPTDFKEVDSIHTFKPNSSRSSHVEILLTLRLPDHAIHSLPHDPLRIDHFTDDTGKDLTRTRYPHEPWGGYWPALDRSGRTISPDRHAAVIPVHTDRAPSPTATAVLLRGAILLRTFSGETTSPRQPLPLRFGRTVAAGPFTFNLRKLSAGNNNDGSHYVRLHFQTDQPIQTVKDIRFYHPTTGQEVRPLFHHRSDATPVGGAPPLPAFVEYTLPGQHDELSVEITTLDDVRDLSLPIDLKAPLPSITTGPLSPAK